ncbi:hypothetical protein PGB90_009145 [Kerria lacca]
MEINVQSILRSTYFWWFGRLLIPSFITLFLYRLFFYKNTKSLYGKVVLITGASSGLGEALAHAFHAAGCKIILASRNKVSLERVKNELASKKRGKINTFPAVVLPVDLTNLSYLEIYAMEAISIYGRIDILINNAGMSYRGLIVSTSTDVDYKVMLVNYLGQIALTKALLPAMMEQSSGHIVFISSIQGRFAIPYRSAYTVSKHALQAFSDTLRSEVAEFNINVTTVSPGYIRTNLSINAITGNGKRYGVLDDTTATGYPASYVAEKILWSIIDHKKEIIIAPFHHRLVIYLRTLSPWLYFFIMRFRARSSRTLPDKRK